MKSSRSNIALIKSSRPSKKNSDEDLSTAIIDQLAKQYRINPTRVVFTLALLGAQPPLSPLSPKIRSQIVRKGRESSFWIKSAITPIDLSRIFKQSMWRVMNVLSDTFKQPRIAAHTQLPRYVRDNIARNGFDKDFWNFEKTINGSPETLRPIKPSSLKPLIQDPSPWWETWEPAEESNLRPVSSSKKRTKKGKKVKKKKSKRSAQLLYTPVGGQPGYNMKFRYR